MRASAEKLALAMIEAAPLKDETMIAALVAGARATQQLAFYLA